jgi:hypothetical protein
MEENLIQFHALNKDWLPAPYPALKALPDWYKDMPADFKQEGVRGTGGTVKQCRPFLDALSSGYIIPLCGDVNFAMSEAGELTFECPSGDTSIETHHIAQVAGSLWAGGPVIKFMNPWVVVTPPGYSTLFVPPFNRPEIPFEVLAGVVDTDQFYAEVNFPAACRMAKGSSCTLKRLTPIVQAIPFKRESWQAEVMHADAQRLAKFATEQTHSRHIYREQFWQSKSYR